MQDLKSISVLRAIIRKMCRENGVDPSNVVLNKKYHYIETVNVNKPDLDFCTTEYYGEMFKVQYRSGCFNPYITKIG